MNEYRKYEPIFGSLYLSRLIGKGSFGKVYEIVREEFGVTYRSALKIITVPQDNEDIRTLTAEGMSAGAIKEYYNDLLRDFINENEIMSKLKGNSNIVSYEDHQIIPHDDGIGYDILIRMELLTPLLDRMMEKRLDEKEVVKLGIDMCKALGLCHRKNIIHRDIKPQNIFISDSGDYKLGDFGIARTMEKTTGGMSKKGTYKYMAPEVFRGEHYDSTVDLYSLGIVLYSLLNGNRGPFLPPPPAKVTANEEEEARMRRFRGEPIPSPRDAGVMLSYIIKKACSADPAKRYRTAEQMGRDLENYLANYDELSVVMPAGMDAERTEVDYDSRRYTGSMPSVTATRVTGSIPPVAPYGNQYGTQNAYAGGYGTQGGGPVQPGGVRRPVKKKKKAWPFIVAGMLIVALATAGGLLFFKSKDSTKTIDLVSLMTEPYFSGYDEGRGVLEEIPVIDEAKKEDLLAGIEDDEKRQAVSLFLDDVVFIADMTEGLSNGDTVVISAEYDAAAAEQAGIEVTGIRKEFTVSDLEEFPWYLEDAVEYNGHYYMVFNEVMDWDEAETECESMDGHLATITSSGEQDFIVGLIEDNQGKYNYWLGGTDEGQEGSWYWITGEGWSYSNWRQKQPDNGTIGGEGEQNYLQICLVSEEDTGRYGKWWDAPIDGTSAAKYQVAPYYKEKQYTGYVCEWDGL